jgi:hypothetical protein
MGKFGEEYLSIKALTLSNITTPTYIDVSSEIIDNLHITIYYTFTTAGLDRFASRLSQGKYCVFTSVEKEASINLTPEQEIAIIFSLQAVNNSSKPVKFTVGYKDNTEETYEI